MRIVSLLILLSVLFINTSEAKSFYRKDSGSGIIFYSDQDNNTARQFFSLFDSCARIIHSTLGKRSTHDFIKVHLRQEKPLNRVGGLNFTYKEIQTMSETKLFSTIHQILINHYYSRKSTPAWIISALVHRSIYPSDKHLHLNFRYAFTRHLLNKKVPLNLDFISETHQVTVNTPLLYQYFSEQSDLLLSTLIRHGHTKVHLQELLKTEFNNDKLGQRIIARALTSKKNNTITSQQWFTQQAQKICYNILYPVSIKEIFKRFDAINTATISHTNDLGVRQLQELPLEDLANQAEVDPTYTLTLTVDLISLLGDAPPLARAPLSRIQGAIEQLRQNKKSLFRKNILQAKQEIKQIIQLDSLRTQWLDKIEQSKTKIFYNFPEIYRAHQNQQRRKRLLFTKELQWLDTIEAKFDAL
jgi:hypothetical protein